MAAQVVQHSIRQTEIAKKQTYKAVYAPPPDVEWPLIPSHARQQALLVVLALLKGVKEYRCLQHASRGKKRKRTGATQQPENSEAPTHSITLKSGKIVQVPDFEPPAPRPPPPPIPKGPSILSHLIVGINAVQQNLEDSIASYRAAVAGQPFYPPHHDPTPRHQKSKNKKYMPSPELLKKRRRLAAGPAMRHSASLAFLSKLNAQYEAFTVDNDQKMPAKSVLTPFPFNQMILREEVQVPVKAALSFYDRSRFQRIQTVMAKHRTRILKAEKKRAKAAQRRKAAELERDKASFKNDVPPALLTKREKLAERQTKKREQAAQTQNVRVEEDAPDPEGPKLKKLKVVLVCRPDIEPKALVAHLPTTVCVANGLLKRMGESNQDVLSTATNQTNANQADESDPGIYLVQLNAGAEGQLADALGLRTAAVIGLTAEAPLDELLAILKQHMRPTVATQFLSVPGQTEPYQATRIKHLKAQVPVNPKQARQAKKEKKAARLKGQASRAADSVPDVEMAT